MKGKGSVPRGHDSRRARRVRREPVEIALSVAVTLGDRPEDRITLMRERRLRMVGSIVDYRDRILRSLANLLLQVGRTRLGPRSRSRPQRRQP